MYRSFNRRPAPLFMVTMSRDFLHSSLARFSYDSTFFSPFFPFLEWLKIKLFSFLIFLSSRGLQSLRANSFVSHHRMLFHYFMADNVWNYQEFELLFDVLRLALEGPSTEVLKTPMGSVQKTWIRELCFKFI